MDYDSLTEASFDQGLFFMEYDEFSAAFKDLYYAEDRFAEGYNANSTYEETESD